MLLIIGFYKKKDLLSKPCNVVVVVVAIVNNQKSRLILVNMEVMAFINISFNINYTISYIKSLINKLNLIRIIRFKLYF